MVYVPPENSNFHNEDELALLESEITSFRSENKCVIITGDFNARTSQLRDYTENDEFLAIHVFAWLARPPPLYTECPFDMWIPKPPLLTKGLKIRYKNRNTNLTRYISP